MHSLYDELLNSEMGWFRKGKQVHRHIIKTGFEYNWLVAHANKMNLNEAYKIFADMYVKPI